MATTLLEYLTQPNPLVNRDYAKTGSNTELEKEGQFEGSRPWEDFNYEHVIACFGDILQLPLPPQRFPPPSAISPDHLFIIDESSVTNILVKSNHTIVQCA
ncbi:hypothetical protein M501DRAFT_998539 [Patellaria atrata CBS 101060]|uniref:Uncharacterized protein n=1 Tax=Patellaria atrata CBS 101060 TaxID=1346257 RepID=A0A9P4SG34_9PEZI|nr:hypothetical protein M501DRAFT_998539 [Patellaria atrata CBS 101060]